MTQIHIDRRDATVFEKLAPATRRILESIIHSTDAEKAVAEVEREVIGARQALVNRLAAAEKVHKLAKPRLEAAIIKAAKVLEEAERQFAHAKQEHAAAMQASNSADWGLTNERAQLTRELQAGADHRLEEFVYRLGSIVSEALVTALSAWPDPAKKEKGLLFAVSSNLALVEAARTAVFAAIERTNARRLVAESRDETTQFLLEECARLAPVLGALEINPPSIRASDAEIGAPIRFFGSSQWLVEELHEPTREERAASLAAAQGRIAQSDRADDQ